MALPAQRPAPTLTIVSTKGATMSKAEQRRQRATGIRPTTQPEREMAYKIAVQKSRAADREFEARYKELAATMPANRTEHRAQLRALRAAVYPRIRADYEVARLRTATFSDRLFGDIRCAELFDLISFAHQRQYQMPKNDHRRQHEAAVLLHYTTLQVNIAIAMLEQFAGDEVARHRVPLVRHEDVKWLPYWQLDQAAGEWVQKEAGGTELQRRPFTTPATETEEA